MKAMTGRIITHERMDDLDVGMEEQAQALRFIRFVNRRMGGTKAALRALRRMTADWPRGKPLRLLDVGTGAADIPLAIVRWARRDGFHVHITAVDRHPVTLQLARQHAGHEPAIEFVQADAMRLMDRFQSGSFDVAHAGMFLHHLDDVQVMTMLRIMDRLTCHGVIWNDLVRGPVEKAAVRVMSLAAPPPVRHDAVVSVAAGFTRCEALDLARRAGLINPRWTRHLMGRFALTSVKPG